MIIQSSSDYRTVLFKDPGTNMMLHLPSTIIQRTSKSFCPMEAEWDPYRPLDSPCSVQPACLFQIPLPCLPFHHLGFNLYLPFCMFSVLASFSNLYTYRESQETMFTTLHNNSAFLSYLLCAQTFPLPQNLKFHSSTFPIYGSVLHTFRWF